MKNRKQRVELMVELIKNQCIGSQEELAGILAEHGYNVTQATLSRDLKMLRHHQGAHRQRHLYVHVARQQLPQGQTSLERTDSPEGQLFEWIPLLTFSGNLAVIKTRNGYAAGIAYDIDMSRCPEILGTIPRQRHGLRRAA